jgi:radical SAM enzyme (TIGR01210 family)
VTPPCPIAKHFTVRLTVKNKLDEQKAYGVFSEPELTRSGVVEDHNIVLTTNKECPFKCTMCDLWQNTLDYRVENGVITKQVRDGLGKLPTAKHLKIYNAGNFFDRQSIPTQDTFEIADMICEYETLIVESHPKLIGSPCFEFAEYLEPQLEVAMGLETVNEEALLQLEKNMTLDDFKKATESMLSRDIFVRAFILLQTPWQNEEEGMYWAKESIDFAQSIGVECLTIIPLRPNPRLALPAFMPSSKEALEEVVAYGQAKKNGRVFGDTWDAA